MKNILILHARWEIEIRELSTLLAVVNTGETSLHFISGQPGNTGIFSQYAGANYEVKWYSSLEEYDKALIAPDVIIFTHPRWLNTATTLKKQRNSFLIYLLRTSYQLQLPQYFNIDAIAVFDKDADSALPGYIAHRILQLDFRLPVNPEPAKATNEIHYFISEDDTDLRILRRVLPLFNRSYDRRFVLIGNKTVLRYIRHELNDHVSFASRPEHIPTMAIGDRYPIQQCIYQGLPSIVVGRYGFGGLVNHDNLHAHFALGFCGRVGGTCDEYIPLELLEYDIESTLESLQAAKIQSQQLAESLSAAIKAKLEEAVVKFSRMQMIIPAKPDKLDNLHFRLYPDIFFPETNKKGQVYLARGNEMLLGSLPEEYKDFLLSLKNLSEGKDIYSRYKDLDIESLLKELYAIKAIEVYQ